MRRMSPQPAHSLEFAAMRWMPEASQPGSRWLSNATPPETTVQNSILKGWQKGAKLPWLRSLRDRLNLLPLPVVSLRSTTGYAAAKPSAWRQPLHARRSSQGSSTKIKPQRTQGCTELAAHRSSSSVNLRVLRGEKLTLKYPPITRTAHQGYAPRENHRGHRGAQSWLLIIHHPP